MYRATYPPSRVITAAQQAWNPRITSRRSSGSSVAARTVEPTRSQKRTVSWRLSGSDCGRAGPLAGAPAAGVAPDSAATALRIRFRWPSATPNFSRSASVTSGKTSRSMAFSAKAVAYWASPIPSSQVSIWSLSLTVVCPPKVLLHFPFKFTPHIALRPRRERPRHEAAERDQQFPPSDGDCHTPLPCEVRKCNDTTPRARCPNDKRVVDHENIQRSRLRKPLGLPTAVLPDPPDTPRCPRCGKPDVPGTCHAGLRVIPS